MYVICRKGRGKETARKSKTQMCENIKMDLVEIGLDGVEMIGLAQVRYCWKVAVNAVRKLRDP
jgi:hypothetical protein